MARVDETEVILSEHISYGESVESSSEKSPAYTDTEVTETERDVTFKCTANCSDTSTGKERKWKVKVTVSGHGVESSGDWEEHIYTSPLAEIPIRPFDSIEVPDHGLSEYNFDVFTSWELWEEVGGQSSIINSGNEGPHTATVIDNSSGG